MKLQKKLFFIVFMGFNMIEVNAQSIVGRWELQSFVYNITKKDGTIKATPNNIKEKGVIITYEFLSNGKFISKQDGQSQEATWELIGNQLKIVGSFTKALAESLGMTDLIYEVETSGNTMNLSVDATKMGPYKKNILTYTYLKL
jgi:hypothetical protein